jgi:hypothetical protein
MENVEDKWEEKFSQKHQRKFWQNKKTGEMTWEKPGLDAPISEADNIWEEKVSQKHNRKFWQNQKTGAMTWEKPVLGTILNETFTFDEVCYHLSSFNI